MAEARTRAQRVRRAASVAAFNGWTTGLFGAFALIGGIWSLPALALGACLCGAACNELLARRSLLRFEVRAAARLALNQALIACAVAGYCLWSIREAQNGAGSPLPVTGDPTTDEMLAGVGEMARGITVLVYAVVIVLTALIQGLTAIYYSTRRRHIEAFRQRTPAWILSLHAQGAIQ